EQGSVNESVESHVDATYISDEWVELEAAPVERTIDIDEQDSIDEVNATFELAEPPEESADSCDAGKTMASDEFGAADAADSVPLPPAVEATISDVSGLVRDFDEDAADAT